MDFGSLPPEVNSGLMYAGPGSASLRAAAASWQSLAGDLRTAAASSSSVIAGLTDESWLGPSSASMAAAAAPYITWLKTTAAQAEQTANQARAVAGAYEAAFAATVPPPVVAANRSQLMLLHATNLLGQNAAAIAATEAQYTAMWAQDAATMYRYAATAAAAATLKPFDPAPPTTNPNGPAAQGAAVSQATTQNGLSHLTSTMPQVLRALASPAPSQAGDLELVDIIGSVPAALLPANVVVGTTGFGMALQAKALTLAIEGATAALPPALPALTAGAGPAALSSAGLSGAAPAVSAGLGSAHTLGKLSVPPGWAASTPEVKPLALELPDTPVDAAAAAALDSSGSVALYGDIALANLAATSLAGNGFRGGLASSMNGHAPDQLAQFVAELSKKPGSQVLQHWNTDAAQLDGLLAELSKKPGIHAVHLKGGKKPDVRTPETDPDPQPG